MQVHTQVHTIRWQFYAPSQTLKLPMKILRKIANPSPGDLCIITRKVKLSAIFSFVNFLPIS